MSSTVLSQENLIGAASANATEMFVEPKRTSVYSILESTSETEVKIHGAALAIFLSCVGKFLFILSWILICLTFPFSLIFAMRIVAEYERAVIFRLGKLLGPRGPGLFFILPCVDTYHRIDLRVLSFDIPPQELLSKDSVTVSVDAAVYFRVHDPIISVTNINDAFASTKLLAQTTLRNVFGTKNLTQMLSEREEMSRLMRTILDEATFDWGVKVERVEVKDIRLPHEMMRSMAVEAETKRCASAMLINSIGERNSASALVDAANVLTSESSIPLRLRYLQTLNDIAHTQNSTLIFPVPINLMSVFQKDDLSIPALEKKCEIPPTSQNPSKLGFVGSKCKEGFFSSTSHIKTDIQMV